MSELQTILRILATRSDKWIVRNLDTTRLALGQRMAELSRWRAKRNNLTKNGVKAYLARVLSEQGTRNREQV